MTTTLQNTQNLDRVLFTTVNVIEHDNLPVVSRKRRWTGRAISALPALALLSNGVMSLLQTATVTEGLAHLGYPSTAAPIIGVLALVCAIAYIVPRTSLLGAVLLTGYLGGAMASHLRIGEPVFAPLVTGMLVWGGLYLRDDRLGMLLAGKKANNKISGHVDFAALRSTLQ